MRVLHILLLLPAWLLILAGVPRSAPARGAWQNTSLDAHSLHAQDPPHAASAQAAPDVPPVRANGSPGHTSPRCARAAFTALDQYALNTRAAAAAAGKERLSFVRLLLHTCTGLLTTHSNTAPPDLQG